MRLSRPRVPDRGRELAGRVWRRVRTPARVGTAALTLLLVLYAGWPYATLWKLHLAVMRDDQTALAGLVDVASVRQQIARRLNKDQKSLIGDLSDPFIAWLEQGIRQHGSGALESLVTLDWTRDQLIPATAPGLGFLSALSYCFFDGVRGFTVTMDRGDGTPVHLRMRLGRGGWRVVALYY